MRTPTEKTPRYWYLLLLSIVRHVLWFILLGVFIWQAFFSWCKYMQKDTSNTIQRISAEALELPTISFCPIAKSSAKGQTNALRGKNATFTEYFEARKVADHVVKYEAPGAEELISMNDSGKLPESWAPTFTLSPFDLTLVECYSYTSPVLVQPGYASSLQALVKYRSGDHTLVYINEPGQTFLAPTILFGRDMIKLPDLKPNQSGYIQYQISITEQEKFSTVEKPCHTSKVNYSIAVCINDYYESLRQCNLIWTEKGKYNRTCDTHEDFLVYQEIGAFFIQASEEDIHNRTGCYYLCKYKTYVARTIIDELGDAEESDPEYNLNAWFFLAPGAYVFEKEILVYDGYDLIGNIGGFLGLFLGISVLSMYDNICGKVLKLKYFS